MPSLVTDNLIVKDIFSYWFCPVTSTGYLTVFFLLYALFNYLSDVFIRSARVSLKESILKTVISKLQLVKIACKTMPHFS